MDIYFIRHAQSTNNELFVRTGDIHGRTSDPHLTAIGRQQADRLADLIARADREERKADYKNLGGFGVTHLYCSLMTRSIQTAQTISAKIGVALNAHQDVYEYGGIFEYDDSRTRVPLPGPDAAYFADQFPQLRLPDGIDRGGWWQRQHEPREALYRRGARVLAELCERHDGDDRVALVSHGGFYQAFMAALFTLPAPTANGRRYGFAINNCAITRIHMSDSRIALVYANRTDFLPTDLITI